MSNNTVSGISGFKSLKPNSLLNWVVDYLEHQLPLFVNSHTYEKIIVKKKNETQHSTALSIYLMKNQDKLTFMNEISQKGSSKIDIGVYDKASDDLIFTIEAKVLPTPKGSKAKPRSEAEYVYSSLNEAGAGIERFKKGLHGLNTEEKPLPESGMIAYIKDNDFDYWVKKINQWIIEAGWDSSEILYPAYFKSMGKLTSIHLRLDNSNLKLHHFWLRLL